MLRRTRSLIPLRSSYIRNFGVNPEKTLAKDEPSSTSWNNIFDRTAEVFFMTEMYFILIILILIFTIFLFDNNIY